VCALAWGDRIEQLPDFLPEGVDIASGGFAKQRLEFGKELFDRVQIRRVGGRKSTRAPIAVIASSTPATL
jgi:hypothetical protein